MGTSDWHDKLYLTPTDIGNILRVGMNTRYQIIRQMPHIKIGNTYRISTIAFQHWLKENKRKNARQAYP